MDARTNRAREPLQWGRGFEAAETDWPVAGILPAYRLQWGRGFEAAETVR